MLGNFELADVGHCCIKTKTMTGKRDPFALCVTIRNLTLMINHMPTIARPDDRSVNLNYIDYCSIFNDKIQTLRVKNWYSNLAKTHYCEATTSGKNDKPLNPDLHSNEKKNLNMIIGEFISGLISFPTKTNKRIKTKTTVLPCFTYRAIGITSHLL